MTNKTLSICAAIILLSSFSTLAQTKQKTDSRNVLDYYKLISENLLTDYAETAKLTIRDTKNGYLEIVSADRNIQDEVALFRKDNGSALLLVSRKFFSDEVRTGYDRSFLAYELSKIDDEISMDDVTSLVLPSLSERENLEIFNLKRKQNKKATYVVLEYQLPRKGTIIEVIAQSSDVYDFEEKVKIYELHLKNDKFLIIGK